jgi:hypothetical protein
MDPDRRIGKGAETLNNFGHNVSGTESFGAVQARKTHAVQACHGWRVRHHRKPLHRRRIAQPGLNR